MKILMVLGRSAGGIGSHVDQLARELRSAHHEVAIVTDPSTAKVFGWPDAHLLWPFIGARTAVSGPIAWHRIMRLSGQFDVVHAHGHQAAVVAGLAVARARPRPAFVVSLHNELPGAPSQSGFAKSGSVALRLRHGVRQARAGFLRRVVAAALKSADLVTGAGQDLVDLARSLEARRAELAPVASPSVGEILERPAHDRDEQVRRRTELLVRHGLPAQGPLVLTISRVAPQKDLHTLVRAAAASRAGASWVVVGGGDDALRASLESQLSGIRLRFLGRRRDVADWLAAADVFVLTSLWEARALVVQEAMAAGVPVVTTRAGGLPELIASAGVLVPVGDWAAIAREVDGLLADDEARERLGRAGRALASTWDTPQTEARRWVERYTAALDS